MTRHHDVVNCNTSAQCVCVCACAMFCSECVLYNAAHVALELTIKKNGLAFFQSLWLLLRIMRLSVPVVDCAMSYQLTASRAHTITTAATANRPILPARPRKEFTAWWVCPKKKSHSFIPRSEGVQ